MPETVNASFKDLLSTGYFYGELKTYMKSTETNEIDLISFNRYFAVPYLIKKSESYKEPAQTNRARILDLAVKFLSNVNDGELAETIFALKKVAEFEVQVNEKEICTTDQPSRAQSCRQRSESAQFLGKLLTSIIKMFRLPQIVGKRDNSDEEHDSVENSIKSYWDLSIPPAM
ncbi:MAG: hypothetical protein ACP5SH_05470 [Syntrophobacteraceae bacterium]